MASDLPPNRSIDPRCDVCVDVGAAYCDKCAVAVADIATSNLEQGRSTDDPRYQTGALIAHGRRLLEIVEVGALTTQCLDCRDDSHTTLPTYALPSAQLIRRADHDLTTT